jgi:hypothetical protein
VTGSDSSASVALGLAWACSTLAVGVVGWLLVAISDRRQEAVAGWVLLGLAALGLVATIAVVSNRRRAATLTFAMVASVAFVVGGVVAAILVATQENAFLADVLLVGGLPVIGGLVTGLLGRRARVMAA